MKNFWRFSPSEAVRGLVGKALTRTVLSGVAVNWYTGFAEACLLRAPLVSDIVRCLMPNWTGNRVNAYHQIYYEVGGNP